MKKFALICAVVGVFVIYSILHHQSSAILANKNTGSSSNSGGIPTSNQTGSSYKDGTYTGSSADAFYGTIQVQATIQRGKITDVQFVQYPNDRSESIQINQQADPLLAQEAIQAQSATVDIISGATDSSQAFMQSLSSALSQAKS